MRFEDIPNKNIAKNPDESVQTARLKIWRKRNDRMGTICPCCGQNCRVYKRAVTATMVKWLVAITITWRERGGKWVDVNHPRLKPYYRSGDYAKLRHWSLVEHRNQSDKSNTDRQIGLWMPTELGVNFVDGEERVKKYAHVYLGKCIQFSGPEISIWDILGENFDFSSIVGEAQ